MAETRLKVVIIGAGVAGLSAGVMLREFADVIILESAAELREAGAAVTLGMGAVAILRRVGINLEREGGVVTEELRTWNEDGELLYKHPLRARELCGEDIISIHRADLQASLLRSAVSQGGPGTPCRVLLGHKVVDLDPEAGTVSLANGTSFVGDVVIAADGIRSRARPFVAGPDAPDAQPTGEAAYRMLVRRADLRALGADILEAGALPPAVQMVRGLRGPPRKWIAYPVRGGALLNFIAYVPEADLHEPVSNKWTSTGSIESLLRAHEHFAPAWRDIISAGRDVGVWQLRDAPPLKTWVRGRAILVGDAAHPMLPHQAAGAMSAIEDAEALAVHLRGAGRADVTAALTRVFRVRYKRCTEAQAASRAEGIWAKPRPDAGRQLFERWQYPGAERWAVERPDMVLDA